MCQRGDNGQSAGASLFAGGEFCSNCRRPGKYNIIPQALSPLALELTAEDTIPFCCIPETSMIDLAEKIKQKLKDEIAALEHELHDELPKEIKVARAHGDLSENAEYKYAKERQGYVAARLAQLHQRMANLSLLNLNNLPKDRAAYGSRLVVLDIAKETKVQYKLVTVEEADAAKGLISTTSPIGRALLGKKVGDEVKVATPAGLREYEVVELITIYDEV